MLSYLLEGLTAQSIFERMISLKKKTLKMIASTVMLAFGMTVVPLPALAVSSNIVAETKDKNTLTISQIQDLAVIYNDNAKNLQLQKKQLELQEQTLRNNRRDIENSINYMGGSSNGNNELAIMEQTIASLKQQLQKPDLSESDRSLLQSQLTALTLQYESAIMTQGSMAASMQSSLDSAISGIEQLNDSLDSIENGKDDLNKYTKDLETQMRYTAANLSLGIVQMDKGIELLEDQIALTEQSVKIAELQQKLGMNISTDVEKQQAALKEAKKGLEDQKESLSNLKRTLNLLIGRNAGNPLEVVPMNLPVAIDPAPAYTEKLIKQFTDNNYTLKTLERDKADLKEDGKNSNGELGSDELKKIDYDIEAKDQSIKDQKQAISDDLKALLAKINSDGEAYQVSRQKYVTEKKNFEYAQKKYELGMISSIQLQQAELQLKQAEMTNMSNGYTYYLDWQKYYAAEKGVDMSKF